MSNDISSNPSGGSQFRPNLKSLGGASGKMTGPAGERKCSVLKRGAEGVEVPTPSMISTPEQKESLHKHSFKQLDTKI